MTWDVDGKEGDMIMLYGREMVAILPLPRSQLRGAKDHPFLIDTSFSFWFSENNMYSFALIFIGEDLSRFYTNSEIDHREGHSLSLLSRRRGYGCLRMIMVGTKKM